MQHFATFKGVERLHFLSSITCYLPVLSGTYELF